MGTTQTAGVKTRTRKHRLGGLVMAVGREARRLGRPVVFTTAVSLGSTLTFWWLSFSSYTFDSVRSFLASSTVLIVGLAPGAFLIWLRLALKELELLPTCLRESDVEEEEEEENEVALPHDREEPNSDEPEPGRAKMWLDGAKTRLDKLLELWTQLSVFKDKLLQLGGPRRAVSFLAHPISVYIVGTALLATALLLLAATLSILASAI